MLAVAAVAASACGAGGGSDGKADASPRPGAATSAPPTYLGVYSPERDSTVGTGAIVTVLFTRTITRQADVERGITVTSRPPVPVVGHWFGGRRLDLRPARFWQPGTVVTLHLRLRGVHGTDTAIGSQSKDVSFTIGRDQHSVVNAATHTMTVFRGARVLRVLPVTAGSPQHTTYNGVMVISEKFPVTRMNGNTVGFGGEYDIPDVPHAMRLTASGTFVHGNYWAPHGIFGTQNTSHGCIGLEDRKGGGADTPAGWFYGQSIIGDAVQVVDSPDRVVAPDNGSGGWNLDWAQWTAGSALRTPVGPPR
ncbi:L,D-transpeptidase [Actinacidiphila yeochonensis]|uniref:L,D-transpeptidase n=1 Tax=Actinacidiphila yeochonensis TaxID=89050 RepID=UPI00068DCEBB